MCFLIIILFVCIIIKIIKQKINEAKQNKLIQYLLTTHMENNENINDENDENEDEEINVDDPNDLQANQAVIDLQDLSNEANEKVETFLFIESPFKMSYNFIVLYVKNMILRLFKTKNGYLLTNKESNKIYVPYQNELRPVPFNPYIPISRIPKYVYVDVIPCSEKQFYIKKGNYYYSPYNNNFYSWNPYCHNKEKRKIKDLYSRVKQLEHERDNRPVVSIDNKIDFKKIPVIDETRELKYGPSFHPKINIPLSTNTKVTPPSIINSKVTPPSVQIPTNVTPSSVINSNVTPPSVQIPTDINNANENIPNNSNNIPNNSNNIPNNSNNISNNSDNGEKPIEDNTDDPTIKMAEEIINSKPEEIVETKKESFWSKFGF